jgi:addiction module RelE/StbE family toxin
MKQLFRITEEAKRDVDGITEYIERDNPDAARRFFEQFIRDCTRLSELPHIGVVSSFHHSALHTVRQHPIGGFEKFLIFYSFSKQEGIVEIIRVIHGARDLPYVLGELGEDK